MSVWNFCGRNILHLQYAISFYELWCAACINSFFDAFKFVVHIFQTFNLRHYVDTDLLNSSRLTTENSNKFVYKIRENTSFSGVKKHVKHHLRGLTYVSLNFREHFKIPQRELCFMSFFFFFLDSHKCWMHEFSVVRKHQFIHWVKTNIEFCWKKKK